MSMSDGWIKSYRQMKDWEWYKKPGMFHLFHHLLYNANHAKKAWQGIFVERGQLVTSRARLSTETGISIQSVRTCLNRLKSTSEITIKSTSRFTIITICNYSKYQSQNKETNQVINQVSNKQSTSDQPATNHKQELKNEKNVRNIKKKGNIKTQKILLKEKFQKAWDENLAFLKEKYPGRDFNLQKELILDWVDRNYKKANDRAKGKLKLFFQNWLAKAPFDYKQKIDVIKKCRSPDCTNDAWAGGGLCKECSDRELNKPVM